MAQIKTGSSGASFRNLRKRVPVLTVTALTLQNSAAARSPFSETKRINRPRANYSCGEFAGGVGLYGPDVPDDPLLLPDEAGISPGGWDFIGTSGEVGDTCELFSLPGPTAPGVTLAAPFAPRSGFSGVASPGADCAGATKSAAAAIAARNVFMGIPPFGSLESNAPAIRHVPNRTKRKTRSSSYEEARATPQIAQAFRSCGPSTQLCRPPLETTSLAAIALATATSKRLLVLRGLWR